MKKIKRYLRKNFKFINDIDKGLKAQRIIEAEIEEENKEIYKKKNRQLDMIEKLVDEVSFFPEMERKSRESRVEDNIKWLEDTGYVNTLYNLFGLDIKDFREQDDYFERWVNKRERASWRQNGYSPSRHKNIVANKFLFYSYIEGIAPGSIPKTYFLFNNKRILAPLGTSKGVLETIKSLPVGDYISKESGGQFGSSIMKITISDEGMLINGGKISEEEFLARIGSASNVMQDYIVQHDEIAKFNPSTLNTLRIVTTRLNKEPQFFAAVLRCGADAGQIVDNLSQGGVCCAVNENGEMDEYGYYYEKPRVDRHPVSGEVFKDNIIPYWNEALELVKELHNFIPGLPGIGWDVAITKDGVKIIEANSNYCIKMLQMSSGGLKAKWEENKCK